MPKKHSLETRVKISEGVKNANREKKIRNSRTAKNKQKASEKFSEGHPDGLAPSAVRNYGDFGTDVIIEVVGEKADAALPHREERNSSRLEEFKNRKEGISGGKPRLPVDGNNPIVQENRR